MAFSEFTLESVVAKLGIALKQADLFPANPAADIPQWLPDSLVRGTRLALLSEKSRSEFIVAPILLAARELSGNRFAIFSGQNLSGDASLGLSGECDFLLALGPALPPLRSPISAVVVPKKHDVEAGLGQCIAQLVAARSFNEAAGRGHLPMYGCVTTGETWQFLRLVGSTAELDSRRLYLDNLSGILAVFLAVVAEAT